MEVEVRDVLAILDSDDNRVRPREREDGPRRLLFFHRAGDRGRTGDVQLGKLTLYQLSYSRNLESFKQTDPEL